MLAGRKRTAPPTITATSASHKHTAPPTITATLAGRKRTALPTITATSAGRKRSHSDTDDEASSHLSGSLLLGVTPFTKQHVAPNPSLVQSTDDGGGKRSSGEGRHTTLLAGSDGDSVSDSGSDSGSGSDAQPVLQVNLDEPLYEIGTLGIAGRDFSSTFFTHTTQDVEFAKNLKTGNHGFIMRSNYNTTYAKLLSIEVDNIGRRTFRFQYDINSEYTKDIFKDRLVAHIRRANQFIPNSVGSFVITQNSTNAGHSIDIFKLRIGPQRSEKHMSKSGKSKGVEKSVRFCQVVGWSNQKARVSDDNVHLCNSMEVCINDRAQRLTMHISYFS